MNSMFKSMRVYVPCATLVCSLAYYRLGSGKKLFIRNKVIKFTSKQKSMKEMNWTFSLGKSFKIKNLIYFHLNAFAFGIFLLEISDSASVSISHIDSIRLFYISIRTFDSYEKNRIQIEWSVYRSLKAIARKSCERLRSISWKLKKQI